MVFSEKLAERYHQLKAEQPDCILLMQVGAFMQVMNEDARAVSGVTGLKLKMAGDVDSPVSGRWVPEVGAGCVHWQTGPCGPFDSDRVAERGEGSKHLRGDSSRRFGKRRGTASPFK